MDTSSLLGKLVWFKTDPDVSYWASFQDKTEIWNWGRCKIAVGSYVPHDIRKKQKIRDTVSVAFIRKLPDWKLCMFFFFFLYLRIYTAAGVADCREGDRFRRLFPPFPELVSHELRRGDVWVWTSKEETQYTAIVENVHKRTHTQKKGSDSRKVEELRRRRSIKNRHIR